MEIYSYKEGLPFGCKPEVRLLKLLYELFFAIMTLISPGFLNIILDLCIIMIFLMTLTKSFKYPKVLYNIRLARLLLKKKALRFLRKRIN